MNDDEVDQELADVGAALRESADPGVVDALVLTAGQRKLAHLRRTNRLLAVAAVLSVVAMIGSVAWAGTRDTERGEVASGTDLPTPDSLAAEKLVASLPDTPIDPHSVKLVSTVSRYDSCGALADQLRRVGAAHVGSGGFGGMYATPMYGYGTRQSVDAAASTQGMGSADATSMAFSDGGAAGVGETLGTNVIVEGVDEPDTVKAVGTLVVEVIYNRLRIVDTSKAGIVGSLELGVADHKAGRFAGPSSLLVDGSRVVVFGNESVLADPVPGDPSATRPATNYMTFTFIDISVPSAPKVTQRVRVEGALVAARRVGDAVRVVTSSSLNDLPMVIPVTANGVKPALHQNRLAVAESSVDDWIPEWDTGISTATSPLVGCSDVVVPDTFAGVEMTSLVQFDIDGPFEPRAMGILAPSEDLTATAGDAVVASHVWVDPVEQTGDYKDWSTALHRFSFDDSGPRYVGSGQVAGSIRDDFSLSVIDPSTVGVVTVEGVPWVLNNKAKITVRTLVTDPDSKSLKEAGSLVPAGSSEGISGLRFMGDRLLISSGLAGNLVSSVDLSTPTAPADRGSVTLPGSGEYFHPLGGNRVLVIGMFMRGEGRNVITGLHSTVLDISGEPRIAATWSRDYVSSNVGGDHHAFTWWASRSLAGFGVYINRPSSYAPPESLFLNVGQTEIGARFARPREADLGRKCPIDQFDRTGCDDSGPPTVTRVLVVNGAPWLYTTESLERLDPDSLASTSLVSLPPVPF